jgi:hypothetical protein
LQSLNTLSSGVLAEAAPLCNGESQEYQQFLKSKEMVQLRNKALATLCHKLKGEIKEKPLNTIYWFEPSVEHPLLHNKEPVSWNWTVPKDMVANVKVIL